MQTVGIRMRNYCQDLPDENAFPVSPITLMLLTSMPASVNRLAISAAGSLTSTYCFSQFRETFTIIASKTVNRNRRITLNHRYRSVASAPGPRQTEGKTGIFVRVDTAALQYPGMHHAGAPQFNQPLLPQDGSRCRDKWRTLPPPLPRFDEREIIGAETYPASFAVKTAAKNHRKHL